MNCRKWGGQQGMSAFVEVEEVPPRVLTMWIQSCQNSPRKGEALVSASWYGHCVLWNRPPWDGAQNFRGSDTQGGRTQNSPCQQRCSTIFNSGLTYNRGFFPKVMA
jgi:hypothetical protein